MPSIPISLPLLTEDDLSENELLCELKQYMEAVYSENKENWYGCLLETDVLTDSDSIHILPSSLYLLLFHIATFSEDAVSSENACSLYLSLLQRHVSFQLDFVRCLPPGETYLSTLDLLGYSESAIDLELLFRTHKEYREEINWDGSLRPSMVNRFPSLQLRHYLEILTVVLRWLEENPSSDKACLSDEVLVKLLERLLRCLVEARAILLYETIGSSIASVFGLIQKRGLSVKEVVERVVRKESIPSVRSLYYLLLRVPLVNPGLEVLRVLLAYQILLRLEEMWSVC
ncbi:hypothetical protein WA538_002237 [Blastocystis sp. DL]